MRRCHQETITHRFTPVKTRIFIYWLLIVYAYICSVISRRILRGYIYYQDTCSREAENNQKSELFDNKDLIASWRSHGFANKSFIVKPNMAFLIIKIAICTFIPFDGTIHLSNQNSRKCCLGKTSKNSLSSNAKIQVP